MKPKHLKAYSVFLRGNQREAADLVFAYTAQQARIKGWYNAAACYDGEYLGTRAVRVPEADGLCRMDYPYVENDREIMKKAGWRKE